MGYTQLTTTEDGLPVDCKRLTSWVRVEIPHEKLLPVWGKVERSYPLSPRFFVASDIIRSWVQELGKPVANQAYLVAISAVLLLIAEVRYFTYTRWQTRFILTTGNGDFSVVAQPADDAVMQRS